MRFKFNPDKMHVARLIERSPKMLLSNMTIGQFVDRPEEIPESAVRPGTYFVRYGKGEAFEFEYIESIAKWFKKGRVYVEYGYNPEWQDLPCLRDHEIEAMNKVAYMLTNEWQRVLMAYNLLAASRIHRRNARNTLRKLNKKVS